MIGSGKIREIADDLCVKAAVDYIQLADSYISESITLGEWKTAMQERIRNLAIAQYALGIGGFYALADESGIKVRATTFSDIYLSDRKEKPITPDNVDKFIAKEHKYFAKFADQAPQLSEAQIKARSALYARSSRKMYDRGTLDSLGIPDMPENPLEQRCGVHCQCYWDFKYIGQGSWQATWVRNATDSCDDCIENEKKYSSLIVENGRVLR